MEEAFKTVHQLSFFVGHPVCSAINLQNFPMVYNLLELGERFRKACMDPNQSPQKN